jgi:hypothetical protein
MENSDGDHLQKNYVEQATKLWTAMGFAIQPTPFTGCDNCFYWGTHGDGFPCEDCRHGVVGELRHSLPERFVLKHP